MPFRRMLWFAMQQPERYVIELDYTDVKGITTRRTVSPIRLVKDRTAFIALCLGREECRRFNVANCSNAVLKDACEVSMPMPLKESNGRAEPGTG